MRKILCVVFLIFFYCNVFAKAEFPFEVQMIMFKCGVSNKDNAIEAKSQLTIARAKPAKRPSASGMFQTMWHIAVFEYDGNSTYVFCVIKKDVNTVLLALTNFLLPLSAQEEEKYSAQIAMMKDEADYINGVKARPPTEKIK